MQDDIRKTESESLRRERGESTGEPDPKERMAQVPLAPGSAGVLGVGTAPGADQAESTPTVEADEDAAKRRAALNEDERGAR